MIYLMPSFAPTRSLLVLEESKNRHRGRTVAGTVRESCGFSSRTIQHCAEREMDRFSKCEGPPSLPQAMVRERDIWLAGGARPVYPLLFLLEFCLAMLVCVVFSGSLNTRQSRMAVCVRTHCALG